MALALMSMRRRILVGAVGIAIGASIATPVTASDRFAERRTALQIAVSNLYASRPGAPSLPPPSTKGPGAQCEHAVAQAAKRHGVPLKLMRAVSLVESGRTVTDASGVRRRTPWPWTVNMEGEGRWFDTPEETLRYVRREQARGARSFDLGCMQVNHRWHGEAFSSLEDMLDPARNADYAAQFLKSLFDETGDWMRAVGFYHSRTPKFEQIYRRKVVATAKDLPPPIGLQSASIPDAPPRRARTQSERRAAMRARAAERRRLVPEGDGGGRLFRGPGAATSLRAARSVPVPAPSGGVGVSGLLAPVAPLLRAGPPPDAPPPDAALSDPTPPDARSRQP